MLEISGLLTLVHVPHVPGQVLLHDRLLAFWALFVPRGSVLVLLDLLPCALLAVLVDLVPHVRMPVPELPLATITKLAPKWPVPIHASAHSERKTTPETAFLRA